MNTYFAYTFVQISHNSQFHIFPSVDRTNGRLVGATLLNSIRIYRQWKYEGSQTEIYIISCICDVTSQREFLHFFSKFQLTANETNH